MARRIKRLAVKQASDHREHKESPTTEVVPLAIVPRRKASIIEALATDPQSGVEIDPRLKAVLA